MKMNKKILISGILGVFCSASSAMASSSSLMICNAGSCVKADDVVTAEALYNRLGELFTKNVGRKMTFCDADPAIHLCYQQSLKMTASSDLLMANIGIDSADVLEAKPSQTNMSMSVLLDMSVEANKTYPSCETALAQVNVASADKVSVSLNGFGCALTSNTQTVLNLGFAVDYIDFENATIGGYYVMDASGSMKGNRTAYGLMRLADPVSGMFDLAVMPDEEKMAEVVIVEPVQPTEPEVQSVQECPPCIAEQVRDDEAVRSAIDAAARAEAEAKAAADRAVKMAEEAAQTTSEYAQKKAAEAEKAKQEAEKASEMARAARNRVDNKVAAMNCQTSEKSDAKQIVSEKEPVVSEKEPIISKSEPIQNKVQRQTTTTTTKQVVITHTDADGNVRTIKSPEVIIQNPTEVQKVQETQMPQMLQVSQPVPQQVVVTQTKRIVEEKPTQETFSDTWNRRMNNLGSVFWLE